MTGPELRVVDGEPAGPVEESPERCLCGRIVAVVIRMRNRSIGLCKICFRHRLSSLKRGSGRGA